jgi:hypothetical protein
VAPAHTRRSDASSLERKRVNALAKNIKEEIIAIGGQDLYLIGNVVVGSNF